MDTFWADNWQRTRQRLTDWWAGRGLVLCITAPAASPRVEMARPAAPASLEAAWLDPAYRSAKASYELANTYFGGESFPYFDAHIGPGNLATFLGSPPRFAPDTVWYDPCITDDRLEDALVFDPKGTNFQRQLAILSEGLRVSRGRFLVGMPDLIENIDALASLRGTQTLLMDLIERPEWVKCKLAEINRAYFSVFDAYFGLIQDEWGGNAFSAFRIWGPGKTAKVQCDASAAFSPAMFSEFVVPPLAEQCRWLDYSLYHLDGTQCICHLDSLLSMPDLNGIEWTPQAGRPGGGDPTWFGLYRRILAAGKTVQAVGVRPAEVLPLLDAIGTEGVFLTVSAQDEREARSLVEVVERRR